jgi:hypothetical protein
MKGTKMGRIKVAKTEKGQKVKWTKMGRGKNKQNIDTHHQKEWAG